MKTLYNFFVPYRMVRFGAQKLWCLQHKNGKIFSNPLLLQNGIPDLIFFHRMEAYTGVNPTHSVEEMAGMLQKSGHNHRHQVQCSDSDVSKRMVYPTSTDTLAFANLSTNGKNFK